MKLFLIDWRKYLAFASALVPSLISGQILESQSSLVEFPTQTSFSFQYDNDLGVRTDEYYTQGISLEFYTSKKEDYPFLRLLPKSAGEEEKIGLRWIHQVYTPTSIVANKILSNDHPYSAHFQFAFVRILTNKEKHRRISTQNSVGLIGPLAFGNAMQTFIHQQTGDNLPQGWKYQIGNQLLLGTKFRYEKSLMKLVNKLEIQAVGMAELGNLETYGSVGVEIRLGEPFYSKMIDSLQSEKKMSFHFYSQSFLNAIGYDARLQGRMFTNDVHQLATNQLHRIIFQQQIGAVFSWPKFQLSVIFAFKTKEIITGSSHAWTGLRFGFGL